MTGAGDLRFNVRFDKLVGGDDAAGGATDGEWTEQFTRRADIRPLKGGEPVQQQRLKSVQPALIIVRKDSETSLIKEDWRAVELQGSTEVGIYAIKTVEDMEREGEFLTIMAERGAPDA
jgi:head-tail adaptor